MALGALDIIIAADTAQLRKGMDTAVGIMQSSTKTMENVAKTAGTAIAGYFTFDAIKGSIKHTLDFADSLSKMSQKVGISVDALYAMQAAGKLSDVNLQTLEKSLLKFNKGLGTAETGAGGTENALKNLGISLKDSSGHLKMSDQYLLEVAEKFKSMPNGIAKSTLAMELFGKSGADMIPLLNGGSDALREYSGIMDQDTAQAAEKFNDSLTTVGLAVDAVWMQMASNLSPMLSAIADDFTDVAKEGKATGRTLGDDLAGGMKIAIGLGYQVAASFSTIGHVLGNFGASASLLAEGDFSGAKFAWNKISEDAKKDEAYWDDRIKKVYNATAETQKDSDAQRNRGNQDLEDFKANEAQKEASRKKADANAKKATAEREKAYQEEIKIQKGYLDSYADLEAKDAIEAYNNKITYLNDYADMEAKAAIDQYNLDLFYIDDLASRQASYAVSLYDSITPDSEKIISKYTDIFETMKDMPVEMLKSFGDKMNEELANIKSGMDFSANIEFDPSMMDGMAKSIAGVGKSMMLLTKEEDQYQKNKSKYAEGSLEYAKNEENHTENQIAGYANIAGAMSSMFEQGSKEAEAFKAIEAGLAIVSGAKAVVQAMTNGDPYTAIARGVAMAAMVASVLGSAGVSGGSGSASTPAPATSMGTVLGGGAYGQSESMTNITDLLSSIHTSEYSQLRDINRAVTSMSENILSAVTNIFRSGITDTGGVQLNSFNNAQERIDKTLAIIDKSFLNIGGIMSNAFMASGAGLFQALGFGGSSKQYIAGSGFNVAGGTVGDKASGNVGASTYVDVETASKNFWGSASYSHNITSTALDSASSQSIALIYRSFSDTMLSINKGLGTDLGNSISGYAVKAINISTAGLTGDEVVKKLNDTFSALGDTMANDVFGTVLSQYQKLGEGMLETAVRVITEKEVLLQDLANVNKTITGNVLDITQSLVDLSGGLTKFSDANSSYFDNYFSDAEKSAVYQKNLESAYKSMNITMPITIAGFRSTVDALDLNTASGRETYVSLMNIADAQKTYMDSLKDLTDLIPKPDMMLSKVTDTTNGGTDSLNTQLLVQVVKALNAIKTNNQFNAIGAII